MPLAWFDGKFIDKNAITLTAGDFGFSRGLGVYELTRVYGGVPFRLDDHWERFAHGAVAFNIVLSFKYDQVKQAVQHLIRENKYPHSVVKFYVTAGECAQAGPVGLAGASGLTPHFMVIEDEVKPLHPEAPKGLELYRRGVAVKSVPFSRQMPTVKSVNYAAGYCAAQHWAKEGWDDIIYTHPDGYLTETTISNFFAVIDGVLCTPDEGMLFGVTRQVVLELAKKKWHPGGGTAHNAGRYGAGDGSLYGQQFHRALADQKT